MREFKVRRLNPHTLEEYTEELVFQSGTDANAWADKVNEGGGGTHRVIDLELLSNFNEHKYEY